MSLGMSQHLGLAQGLVCGWQKDPMDASLWPSCPASLPISLTPSVSVGFSQGAGIVARRGLFPCSRPRPGSCQATRT